MSDSEQLGRNTARGGTAVALAQVTATVVNIVALSFLARMIPPTDFGLLAKVTALTGVAGLLGDMGLSLAVVQSKSINRDQLSAFFWINAAVVSGIALSIASLSPAFAWFYDERRVVSITLAIAMNIVLSGLGGQHRAIMRRQMKFAKLAFIETFSLVVAAVTAIVLAQWMGYWALVSQLLVGSIVRTSLLWIVCGFVPRFIVFETGIRSHLTMGASFTVGNFVNYLVRNADNVLIGRVWGSQAVAFYTKAYALLLMPLNRIAGPMSQVAVPALSRLQSDRMRYREFFRKGCGIAALLQVPISFFAAVAGKDIVLAILGPTWHAAIPVFMALVPNLLASTTSPGTSWIVLSTGETSRYLKAIFINAFLVLIGYCVSVRYGIVTVAWVFSITTVVTRIPTILFALKASPATPADFFLPFRLPVAYSFIASAAVVVFAQFTQLDVWPRLIAKGFVFVTAYVPMAIFSSSGRLLIEKLVTRIWKKTSSALV